MKFLKKPMLTEPSGAVNVAPYMGLRFWVILGVFVFAVSSSASSFANNIRLSDEKLHQIDQELAKLLLFHVILEREAGEIIVPSDAVRRKKVRDRTLLSGGLGVLVLGKIGWERYVSHQVEWMWDQSKSWGQSWFKGSLSPSREPKNNEWREKQPWPYRYRWMSGATIRGTACKTALLGPIALAGAATKSLDIGNQALNWLFRSRKDSDSLGEGNSSRRLRFASWSALVAGGAIIFFGFNGDELDTEWGRDHTGYTDSFESKLHERTHQIAELLGISPAKLEAVMDDLRKELLRVGSETGRSQFVDGGYSLRRSDLLFDGYSPEQVDELYRVLSVAVGSDRTQNYSAGEELVLKGRIAELKTFSEVLENYTEEVGFDSPYYETAHGLIKKLQMRVDQLESPLTF